MAKGKSVQEISSEINQNILNIITPSGLKFNNNSFVLGDNYAKCMVISRYPSNCSYGWLSQVTAIEGTTAKIEFTPCDSANLIRRCDEQIHQLKTDVEVVKDESIRKIKSKAIEDISKMIERISINNEVVGYLNVMLMVQAPTESKLEERVKKVNSTIAVFGGSLSNLTMRQKETYCCISPYGLPNQTVGDVGQRNMPLSTFIGGFVNNSSAINDGSGYLFGKSLKGIPSVLDIWMRNEVRTNSNWFIMGVPGVGKSTAVKNLLIREYALQTRIIICDAEKEYRDLTTNLGGDIVNCGGGDRGKINPLEMRKVPSDEEEEKNRTFSDEGHGMGDLALHFQFLRKFFSLYDKRILSLRATLEECLESLYGAFHITWNTRSESLTSKDYPIMKDLYDLIEERMKQDDNEELPQLLKIFRGMAIGADSFIWNGHTDIETTGDIVDLDMSQLLESDDNIKNAQFFNILSWCWNQVIQNRSERILLVVDEGYLYVDPENPESLKFLRNTSKRIRKYEGSLVFITQSICDLVDPVVKRFGQVIFDNACYKFLMGCDGQNLDDTASVFKLTDSEITLLASQQRGKGILFVGAKRLSMKIEVPTEFLNIMGKSGGR